MTTLLPLSRGMVGLIDDTDAAEIARFKWFASSAGSRGHLFYVARNILVPTTGKRTLIRLHNVLLPAPEGFDVDHINGDGLDNRRSNLRLVDRTRNNYNRHRKKRGCTSQYLGVSWDADRGKWCAQIKIDARHVHLGRFDSEIEAAQAYDKAGLARDSEHFRGNFVCR